MHFIQNSHQQQWWTVITAIAIASFSFSRGHHLGNGMLHILLTGLIGLK